MKWHLDDIPVFLAIIEQGGITAAAQALDAPKSTVSATLSRLEHGLGLRLIERSSRSLRVTAEGEAFYRQALLIMEQARETEALMAGLGAAPKGRLTVALPPAFSQELVAPSLSMFCSRYPGIELEIVVTSHGAALVRDRVDLAVVVGTLEDSELVSLPLISGELAWIASPAWLTGNTPGQSLDEIRRQVQICETRYAQRRMPVTVDGESGFIDLARGIARVNDPLVVRAVVAGGGGISVLPRHYCTKPQAAGQLVEILQHVRLDQASSSLTAIYPNRRLLSPRVRVFLDFLRVICMP